MRIQKCFFGGWMAICLAATSACVDLGPTAPASTLPGEQFAIIGVVEDDSCLGPDAAIGQTCQPLAGVRVEVLDGAVEKGKVAMTDALGRFDLGTLTQLPKVCGLLYCVSPDTRLGASKAGWAANVEDVHKGLAGSPFTVNETIRLGQAPHIVWGKVTLAGSPNEVVPGVRVEVTAGPDAGKTTLTNAVGFYRFDDLATQDMVTIEFSKEGFVTARPGPFNLVMNRQMGTQLQPNPGLP